MCLAAAIAVAAGASQAATLQFELTREFSGSGFNPSGSAPWGTATFVDVVPGQVQLTLTRSSGMTSGEFIRAWFFNLDPAISPTALTMTQNSGPVATALEAATNAHRADGGPFMDIRLSFATSGAQRFDGDFSSAVFTFSATGLTANSFRQYGLGAGNSPNGLLHAAHIQGIPGDGSAWTTNDKTPLHVQGRLVFLDCAMCVGRLVYLAAGAAPMGVMVGRASWLGDAGEGLALPRRMKTGSLSASVSGRSIMSRAF